MKGLLDGDLAVAPRRIKPAGKKPHRLAYIDGDEAALLRARGGGVAPDGGQIMRHGLPSYEDGGDGGGDGSGNGGGDGSNDADGMGGSSEATGDAGDSKGGVEGAVADAMGSMGFSGVSGPADGHNNDNGGDYWNPGGGGGGGGAWNPWTALPAPPPAFAPQMNAQPVYTQAPMAPMPTALAGRTPGGFLASQEAMRALAGYQRPAQPPQGPVAPPQAPQAGAWQAPPPLVPQTPYPMAPVLTGQGGSGGYYDAWNRLSDRRAPGFFDLLHRGF